MSNPTGGSLMDEAQIAHDAKLALLEQDVAYYRTKLEDFGLKTIDRFVRYHPDPARLMRLGVTFAHRDLENVAQAMAAKTPWAVVSGLNPSGPLHFGHKVIFDQLLWLQKQGAEIFIPITNDESYVVGKAPSLAEARRIAYELVIPSIIAMGFEAGRTHIFVDSDYPEIYNVAMDLSTKLTLNKAYKVFGLESTDDGENPGTLFYRGAVQLAQILLPQYPEFGGPKPTIIPVGIDQHPYILLARDIADRKGFIPPAELVMRFLGGLDGKGKMSASRQRSAITLIDDPKEAAKKLKSSYTGGSILAEFQRIHGGVPGICPVHDLRTWHFEKDDRVGRDCAAGTLLCGQCKKSATEEIVEYLAEHQARLPAARKQMNDFLLKREIRSIKDW